MERQLGADGAAGRRPARPEPHHAQPARAAQDAASSSAPVVRAGARGVPAARRAARDHELTRHAARGADAICERDPARLAQVFGNLLNNACKYTQPGRHDLADGVERDGSERRRERSQDTGIGIPPTSSQHLRDVHAGRPLARALAGRARHRPDAGQAAGRDARRRGRGAERRRRARAASSSCACRSIDRRDAERRRRCRAAAPAHARAPPHPRRRRQRGLGRVARDAARARGPRDAHGARRLAALDAAEKHRPTSCCSTSACRE